MRLSPILLLLAATGAHAAGFRDEAVKCIKASDFDALQVVADKPLRSVRLGLDLKSQTDAAEAVDWSILVRRVTPKALNLTLATGGEPFLLWLASNPDALADYVHGGVPGEVGARSFQIWRQIWDQFPESREAGAWRRFAIASALVQSQQVNAMADGRPIDPVERYKFYKKSFDEGALAPSFLQAQVWELRYVAGSWALDSDLEWVRTAMKPEIRNQLSVGDACMMVPYIETNAKGVSVQTGGAFYDWKPMTLKLMTEYGGVCGAISRFGASAAQSLGVPAFPVGQPGHCAFVWKNADHSWKMGNDIFGWGASSQHEGIRMLFGTRPVFIQLYDMARRDGKAFLNAARLTYAASVSSVKGQHLADAVAACPLYLPAWQQLCALEPRRLRAAGRALGVAPYAVADLYRNADGDLYV